MSDIDILLRREDIEKADSLLKSNGYLCKWNKTWIDKFHYHYGYFPPDENQYFLEVHWLLAKPDSPFFLNLDGVFQRSVGCEFEGEPAMVLSPEDQVVYLSVHHAWSHGFKVNLIQLYDLVLLFKKMDINQGKLINIARQNHASKAVYLTLKIVSILFINSIDENFLKKLRPPGFSEKAIELALDIIFDQQLNLDTAFSRFISTDKTYRKVFSFIRSVFPSKQVISEIYQLSSPKLVNPMHYFRRIVDLIRKYKYIIIACLLENKATTGSFKNEIKKNQLKSFLIDI
jgi:hypothetical protein